MSHSRGLQFERTDFLEQGPIEVNLVFENGGKCTKPTGCETFASFC